MFVTRPGAELYKEVKRATDSAIGVPSQCFVAQKAGIQRGHPTKPRVQYCAKCGVRTRVFWKSFAYYLQTVPTPRSSCFASTIQLPPHSVSSVEFGIFNYNGDAEHMWRLCCGIHRWIAAECLLPILLRQTML